MMGPGSGTGMIPQQQQQQQQQQHGLAMVPPMVGLNGSPPQQQQQQQQLRGGSSAVMYPSFPTFPPNNGNTNASSGSPQSNSSTGGGDKTSQQMALQYQFQQQQFQMQLQQQIRANATPDQQQQQLRHQQMIAMAQQHAQQQQVQQQQQQQQVQQQHRTGLPSGSPPSMTIASSQPTPFPMPTQPVSSPKMRSVLPIMNPPTSATSTANTTMSKGFSAVSSPQLPPQPKSAPPKPLSNEEVQTLLQQCDWQDKTIYATHAFLGGSTVNGFLRYTASAQRIKKQRGRQVATSKKKSTTTGEESPAVPVDPPKGTEQEEEEKLKLDTMNPRTAKKIRQELASGVTFCQQLRDTLMSILAEIDPSFQSLPNALDSSQQPIMGVENPHTTMHDAPQSNSSIPHTPTKASDLLGADTGRQRNNNTTTSPGSFMMPPSSPGHGVDSTAKGSTLRKNRKRKLEVAPALGLDMLMTPEEKGRKLTKKELGYRAFEVTRFRALEKGDYVAARFSSHDLWILARIVQDFRGPDFPVTELVNMNQSRRDSLFKDEVLTQDVEEYDGDVTKAKAVSRNLVLPLPRSFAEAAEWCTRCKKGTRIYAMYPQTTSLYAGTVVDGTTYCRGEDDIVVVEFDGDEKDDSGGTLPHHHIPARFVSLMPREFSTTQTSKKKKSSGSSSVFETEGNGKSTSSSHVSYSSQSDGVYGGVPIRSGNEFDMEASDLISDAVSSSKSSKKKGAQRKKSSTTVSPLPEYGVIPRLTGLTSTSKGGRLIKHSMKRSLLASADSSVTSELSSTSSLLPPTKKSKRSAAATSSGTRRKKKDGSSKGTHTSKTKKGGMGAGGGSSK